MTSLARISVIPSWPRSQGSEEQTSFVQLGAPETERHRGAVLSILNLFAVRREAHPCRSPSPSDSLSPFSGRGSTEISICEPGRHQVDLNVVIQRELIGMWPKPNCIDFFAALVFHPRFDDILGEDVTLQ